MRVCFTLPNRRRVCIEIPQTLPPRWRNPIPEPDPEPWIIHEKITKEIAHDLSVLATIQELSTQLSSRIQPALKESVLQSVKNLELPEGVEVSMSNKVQQSA